VRSFLRHSAIVSVAAVVVLAAAIADPARAYVSTLHVGGSASIYCHHAYGYGAHAHSGPHVGGSGPHVIVFDPNGYPAGNSYQPGEPVVAPVVVAPLRRTVDVNCLVGRPVYDTHDDFSGYRVFDACEGIWLR
jgi:hypothetical protein